MTMNNQEKALLVAAFCLVAFIIVGFFLVYNFQQIDKKGVSCISNPLIYAENIMYKETSTKHTCECFEKDLKDINPLFLDHKTNHS